MTEKLETLIIRIDERTKNIENKLDLEIKHREENCEKSFRQIRKLENGTLIKYGFSAGVSATVVALAKLLKII